MKNKIKLKIMKTSNRINKKRKIKDIEENKTKNSFKLKMKKFTIKQRRIKINLKKFKIVINNLS
jgi:hypothetical protein